ncbi:MAG TPA: winged helix-turn-helix transcriptional regulator [Anaerolineaceae bacterium]|jgi:DNA-binding MarR family transcriptional regulator|nr:winged helix-turn-helix transcriptional regulator [Anaerolineaceae bacterium]
MNTLQNHESRDVDILDHIENDPETTQATIAELLGVAVGTVNWHLKRLIEKGYVKVRRIERRKLRYIITPQGIAYRASLLVDYIQSSFDMYRLVRKRSLEAIQKTKAQGFTSIFLEGSDDVAEICRLTCLEQGMQVSNEKIYPIFRIEGLKIFVIMEDAENGN